MGLFDQSADEAQQFLLLWPTLACGEEGADVDLAPPATRRLIGFMLDEHLPGLDLSGELPAIAIGTLVEGSRLDPHARSPACYR